MMRGRMFAYGIVFALLGAACGGAAAKSTGSRGQSTVSVRSIPGVGKVYTNAQGMSLYSPAQEASGGVLCTGSCATIWVPLAAPANGSPTKGSGVSGALSVITRPDGTKQLALDGVPLYTFVQDMSPGMVNGNGVADSFGGQNFTWHVDSGSGAVTQSPSSSGYPGY